jgi:prefoldin subunit 5
LKCVDEKLSKIQKVLASILEEETSIDAVHKMIQNEQKLKDLKAKKLLVSSYRSLYIKGINYLFKDKFDNYLLYL